MSERTIVVFNAERLGVVAFWRIVRWCNAAGASEFSLTAVGSDMDEMGLIWRPVVQALRQFERPEAVRDFPVYCTIEKQSTDLWELSESSIAVLETIGLDDLFVRPNERLRKRSVHVAVSPATLHHFCLYRDGDLMLAMVEEQGAYVSVGLKREEVKPFREQQFGPEDEVVDSHVRDRAE